MGLQLFILRRSMIVQIKYHGNLSNSFQLLTQRTTKVKHVVVLDEVKGSKKSVRLILWEPLMSPQQFIAIRQKVAEMFQLLWLTNEGARTTMTILLLNVSLFLLYSDPINEELQ